MTLRRELLKIDGHAIDVVVRLNPRARRLIVKVHPSTGEVTVVAPSRRAFGRALEFARGEAAWIAKRLAEVPKEVTLCDGSLVPYMGREHLIRLVPSASRPVCVATGSVLVVAGRPEHAPRRLLDFLKREARRAVETKSHQFARAIGARPGRITVRDTVSRWGSCSQSGSLSFSWRLILAPPQVLNYVVAHEVAHLREMNHGNGFWKIVRELVGEIEQPQAWLRKHGAGLHRYAPRA